MRLVQHPFRLHPVIVKLHQLRFGFSCFSRKHAMELYHLIQEACPHLCLLWHYLPPWGCICFGHDICSRRILKTRRHPGFLMASYMTVQHSQGRAKKKNQNLENRQSMQFVCNSCLPASNKLLVRINGNTYIIFRGCF